MVARGLALVLIYAILAIAFLLYHASQDAFACWPILLCTILFLSYLIVIYDDY